MKPKISFNLLWFQISFQSTAKSVPKVFKVGVKIILICHTVDSTKGEIRIPTKEFIVI